MLVQSQTLYELDNFLLQVLQIVKDNQILQGLYASGDSAKELRVEVFQGVGGVSGKLIDGSGSFEYQERGRGPGAIPWSKIYAWLAYKKYGFDWADVNERKRMAFAIWNKIKKFGTKTHISRKPTGVITNIINSQVLDNFISTVASRAAATVSTDFVKGLTK